MQLILMSEINIGKKLFLFPDYDMRIIELITQGLYGDATTPHFLTKITDISTLQSIGKMLSSCLRSIW